jgi:arylsulfatase
MVTGLYPQEHQANSKTLQFDLDQRHLATRLSEQGYQTGLFTENVYLKANEFGFSDSFDAVMGGLSDTTESTGIIDPKIHAKAHGHGAYISFIKRCMNSSSPIKSLSNGLLHKLASTNSRLNTIISKPERSDNWETDDGASSCIDSFFDWIETNDEPFFALFNFLEAHAPYRPQSGYRQYIQNDEFKQLPQTPPWEYYAEQHPSAYLNDLQDLYDGCIGYLDKITKRLMQKLHDHKIFDDTIVIIAGDHGEGFAEPGVCRPQCIGHAGGIEEELLHVPLVIKYPNQRFNGNLVSEVVSLKDIYSTVLTECLNDPPDFPEHAETLHPDTPFAGQALAQRNGITEAMLDNVDEFGLERDNFDNHLVSYYETGTDGLAIKYGFSIQSDCDVREVVKSTGTTDPQYNDEWSQLENNGYKFFDRLETVGNQNASPTEITTETQNQLQDLGYM